MIANKLNIHIDELKHLQPFWGSHQKFIKSLEIAFLIYESGETHWQILLVVHISEKAL